MPFDKQYQIHLHTFRFEALSDLQSLNIFPSLSWKKEQGRGAWVWGDVPGVRPWSGSTPSRPALLLPCYGSNFCRGGRFTKARLNRIFPGTNDMFYLFVLNTPLSSFCDTNVQSSWYIITPYSYAPYYMAFVFPTVKRKEKISQMFINDTILCSILTH